LSVEGCAGAGGAICAEVREMINKENVIKIFFFMTILKF
jgi:hypothetical protein